MALYFSRPRNISRCQVKNSPVLSTTELLPATTALHNTVDIPEKAGHKLDVSQGTVTVRDSSVDIWHGVVSDRGTRRSWLTRCSLRRSLNILSSGSSRWALRTKLDRENEKSFVVWNFEEIHQDFKYNWQFWLKNCWCCQYLSSETTFIGTLKKGLSRKAWKSPLYFHQKLYSYFS